MNELSTSEELGTCYKAHEHVHQTSLLESCEGNTPTVGIHEMCVFCPNGSVHENSSIKGERKFLPLTEIPTSTNSNTVHIPEYLPRILFSETIKKKKKCASDSELLQTFAGHVPLLCCDTRVE